MISENPNGANRMRWVRQLEWSFGNTVVVFAGAGCYSDLVAINLHLAGNGDRLVSG